MRPQCEMLYFGTKSGLDEQFLSRSDFPYHLLDVGGVVGHGWWSSAGAMRKMARATLLARRLLRDYRPDLVVGVGGYASMPAALGAISLRVPLVLMEQNSRPGLTNRLLARFARRVCVAFEEATASLPQGIAEVTGNPVRFAPVHSPCPHAESFSILVLGGSTGAHRLNIGALFAFKSLKKSVIKFTLVHQTGAADEEAVRAEYQQAGIEAEVRPFILDMARALTDADLVVARAGAMTVSEVALAGRPAVFVPYPFHRDRQQEHNARTLVRLGGAVIVSDDANLGEQLALTIHELCSDRERLAAMAQRAQLAARPDAAARVAQTCLGIAEEAA